MYPALHTTASERVKALDFSEDGSGLLAVGLYSGEVHVVSADDGRAYRTFTIQDAAVRAVKFIPGAAVPLDLSAPDCRAPPALTEALPNCDGDEATLAPAAAAPCHLAAGCDDMHVYLYDVHGDVLLRTIKAHDDFIRCIALDPASPFVVTASDDATARVWSRGFELRQTLTGHAHYVMAAAVATLSHCLVGRCVATDGASLTAATIVATASLDTAVRLWFISDDSGRDSPVASTPCVLHGHAEGVSAVAFVRPTVGRLFVVSGSDDREIRLWDAATHCCVAVLLGHTHSVNAVLCSQHASGTFVSVGSDQRAIQWVLSEANDRTWCGGAFTDVETMGKMSVPTHQ